ncbi:hypothetical protein ACEPAH_5208 [Sanghuangporus vaninii]
MNDGLLCFVTAIHQHPPHLHDHFLLLRRHAFQYSDLSFHILQVGGDIAFLFIFESDREKTAAGGSSSTTSSSVVSRNLSSPSPSMDNTMSTGESRKTQLREGDKEMPSVTLLVPDDLEFLMNFYLTAPTINSNPIELQPAELFCQEVISTDTHTNAAAPAARPTAVVQTESACSVMKDSVLVSKGKSSKGNRDNTMEEKNWRPCSYCQKQQKKCTVVQNEPRLCFLCQKKGNGRCPPWASRKGKGKRKPSGTYTPNENTPGCGTLKFN